jgi:Xaa-Pro aminopeptidase
MRTKGAEGLSFDIIVAAGPNGALPHAHPGPRPLQAGDVVVVDMGCVIDGYVSDLTRTFSLGQPGPEDYLTVWQVVYQAQQNALQNLKAGMSSKEADALARDVIKEAGYGDYFGHSLGHGIGLAVHELPRLSYTVEAPLPNNAVVTVEPGIYLPNRFGVRIEDVAYLTDSGATVLSSAPNIAQVAL